MSQDVELKNRDTGTPELHERHIVEQVGGKHYVRTGVPMDYYLHRSLIKLHQWEAAELFYFYWYHGGGKICLCYRARSAYEPKGRADPMRKEQLEQSYNKAMLAIDNLVVRLTIYNVVCIGEWLVDLDKEQMLKSAPEKKHYLRMAFGKNRRMELLLQGLDDLAKHFKIPGIPGGRGARKKGPVISPLPKERRCG